MAEHSLSIEEQAVFDAFEKLVQSKPNTSYVFSYVFATSTDSKTAKPVGSSKMVGSLEEVRIHLDELQAQLQNAETNGKEKKEVIYGRGQVNTESK